MVKLCAFDVETRNRNPEFVCGSIFSDEVVEYFTNPSDMIERLRWHARKGYKLIAHNTAYDIGTLLWPAGEDVSIHYSNDTFSTASWRYGNGDRTCSIWDNMRLCVGMSLEDLGDAIGCPKYQMPRRLADAEDWRRDWVCSTHSIPGCYECYCVRDSEIVWSYANALQEWLGAYGLSLHYSLARSAMDLWQLLDPNQVQVIRSPEIRQLAREALHGGRCEVFQYGHVGRIYTGDFRSHYGSILREIALPSIATLRHGTLSESDIRNDGLHGVCHATVAIAPQHIPPLPVAYRDRVYYPVGRATGVWPINELRSSLESGCRLERVQEAYWTTETVRPFQTVASVLIERRESLRNQHDSRELACKHMLNAIPGRLGMRESTERVTYRRWRKPRKEDELNGFEIERISSDYYLAKRTSLMRASSTSNVMWAACILAEGRVRLNAELARYGRAVTYCDTDGIHATVPLVCEGDMPGMFRDTGVYDTGLYLGSKFYSLETDDGKSDVRAKGIPRKFAREFIGTGRVQYQTAMGVADGILRGISPCVWVDVESVARFAPGTRTILNPGVMSGDASWSPTTPVVFGQLEIDGSDEFRSGIL